RSRLGCVRCMRGFWREWPVTELEDLSRSEVMDFDWARDLSDDQWAAALVGGDSRAPPSPPAEIQSMFVGSFGVPAYEEIKVFWRLTEKYLSECGYIIDRSTRVLDLGVGW